MQRSSGRPIAPIGRHGVINAGQPAVLGSISRQGPSSAMPVETTPAGTNIETSVIVGAIQQATESVFSMMLSLPVEIQPHETVPQPGPVDGVVALLGFTGPWAGTGVLFCDEVFACKIGSAMLMMEVTEINGDVLDGLGEVANMVLGNFKESLESHTGPLGLSVPTVVYGKNFSTRTGIKADWTIVPFRSGDEGRFEVRICIQQLQ